MKRALEAILCAAGSWLLACPLPLWAEGKGKGTKPPSRKRIETLIAELRSANKDPNPKFRPIRSFPKGYNVEAQEKVEKARKKLIALGKDAFPALIEHVQDKGYSRPISTAILRGLSVGEVCFMIIEGQVDLAGIRYKSRDGSDGYHYVHRGYFSQYCKKAWYTRDGLRKWWKDNKNRSLKEMQIEALKWAIARERRIGFPGKKDREHYLDPLLEELNRLTKKEPKKKKENVKDN
jgi:hypothetical protein